VVVVKVNVPPHWQWGIVTGNEKLFDVPAGTVSGNENMGSVVFEQFFPSGPLSCSWMVSFWFELLQSITEVVTFTVPPRATVVGLTPNCT
jgi:hypothetical protein